MPRLTGLIIIEACVLLKGAEHCDDRILRLQAQTGEISVNRI